MLYRYLMTSQKFTGEVDTYYYDGILQKLDMENCTMPAQQRHGFKSVLPTNEAELEAFAHKYNVRVLPAELEITFDMFWNAYGHKINKKRCLPLWDKMSATERYLAWQSCKAYHIYRKKKNKFQYDPETYLGDKMWENDWIKLAA